MTPNFKEISRILGWEVTAQSSDADLDRAQAELAAWAKAQKAHASELEAARKVARSAKPESFAAQYQKPNLKAV